MEFLKSSRVIWRIEEWTAPEPTPADVAAGRVTATPVLCLVAQDITCDDGSGNVTKKTLGLPHPSARVQSPGTPATELLSAQDAAALSALLSTALGQLVTGQGIALSAPTIDDEIANVQAKLADAIARKQAAIDAAMLAEAEALAAAEAAKP